MLVHQYVYAYGAVSIPQGNFDSLVLPYVNGGCMGLYLAEISRRYPNDNIVMVLDGAGWHKNKSMPIPENIRLLSLPSYSPELNPAEHLWNELREKYFHNRAFDSLDTLENHLVGALLSLENNTVLVQSICNWDWIINVTSIANYNTRFGPVANHFHDASAWTLLRAGAAHASPCANARTPARSPHRIECEWISGCIFRHTLGQPVYPSERVSELALLISLFAVGLRLRPPLRDPIWRAPLVLAHGDHDADHRADDGIFDDGIFDDGIFNLAGVWPRPRPVAGRRAGTHRSGACLRRGTAQRAGSQPHAL